MDNPRTANHRIGLDHLSLSVASKVDLEAAVNLFNAKGVPHGEITPLEPFNILALAFCDPDNIQVELTAPLGQLNISHHEQPSQDRRKLKDR